ncbi:UNKNOWN [Stylonychia lemnae]|uniref:Uncharacterized protein n=1 Tax=Stylonychia lemnae TaxID=5949 RepID=A0A078AIQ8_STYLE|nr:UNKNOWN [Stylonychia lemnae]|eukprot:CDW81816.1 UNKNOWN [Stylonychia lemnae]
MNDFKLKSSLNQNKIQSISQRYQTNLQSPKSSYIKPQTLQQSAVFQNLTNNTTVHQEEPSFIPQQNNSSTDYINLWKDFRNDIRKKLETTTNVQKNPLTSRSKTRDISQTKTNEQDQNSYRESTIKNSFVSNSNNKSTILNKQNNDQFNYSQRIAQFQPENNENKLEYDLKRASKIQDIFQKYLKEDPIEKQKPNADQSQTRIQNQSYLRQSPARLNNGKSRQSEKFLEKKNERDSLNPGSLVSSQNNRNYHNHNVSNSTPYTPKRQNNFAQNNLYDSVNQTVISQQSPITNLMKALEQKAHQTQLISPPVQGSHRKSNFNSSIENLSQLQQQKLQINNFSMQQPQPTNKSPRVSFSINQFSKSFRKEEIMSLRQALVHLNEDEAEGLPFGLTNELLKLADAINEKLGKSSHKMVLNHLK